MIEQESRRAFCRSCGRVGAFTALTAVCGVLISRGPDCINLGRCHGCDLFKDCSLPDAKAIKKDNPLS